MHIADGYLSPATVAVSYAVCVPLWAYGFKKLKEKLNEETLPLIGALSALSFVIMMFNIPIPGGTSGHAIGAALIAILFDPWIAFVSVSLVLLVQSVVFGDGGISALALNSFAMGFVASFVGYYVFKWLKDKKFAPFVAGYVSIVAASFVVALVLGIQPMFWSEDGKPLYFPFDLKVTIPAMVGEHLLFFGVAEGIFTQIVYNYLKKEEL
ncbi:MAG: cobalt transporter CbiM [Epsilonproteobacteria bacterium]|nr:cobalt transporter CbiM [Campylobacterota bacterium]